MTSPWYPQVGAMLLSVEFAGQSQTHKFGAMIVPVQESIDRTVAGRMRNHLEDSKARIFGHTG